MLVLHDHLITGPQGCSGSARAAVASAAGGFAHTWASLLVFQRPPACPERLGVGRGAGAAVSASNTCEIRGEKCIAGAVLAPCSHLRARGGTAPCPICSIGTMYGSACRLQRQTVLVQTLSLKPSALRPRANRSTSLYLSFLICKVGFRTPCLSRMVGELNKQWKAPRRMSVKLFYYASCFIYVSIPRYQHRAEG